MTELCRAYALGQITRQQFVKSFREEQTINFDCKGTADATGVFMTYRGIKARIENGLLVWGKNTAENSYIFQRQVDYAFNQELSNFKNASYCAQKAYEASLAGDYDRRALMLKKQHYFLKQAEKWENLWT